MNSEDNFSYCYTFPINTLTKLCVPGCVTLMSLLSLVSGEIELKRYAREKSTEFWNLDVGIFIRPFTK